MSKLSTRNVGISKSLQALPRPFLEFSFFTKKLTSHVITAQRFLRQADRADLAKSGCIEFVSSRIFEDRVLM